MQASSLHRKPFAMVDRRAAFTLVELIVSTGIIALIMLILVSMTDQVSKTWRSSSAKIETFQEARDGFETMARHLAQATLNTNWDYLDGSGNPRPKVVGSPAYNNFIPVTYGRTADLRFISGPMSSSPNYGSGIFNDGAGAPATYPTHGVFFHAPLGLMDTGSHTGIQGDTTIMNNAINSWGYFLQAGYDPNIPSFISQMQQASGAGPGGANGPVLNRWRMRLYEFRQPSDYMSAYDNVDDVYPHWFCTPMKSSPPPTRVMADNIIALVFRPKLSKDDEDNLAHPIGSGAPSAYQLCPWYFYDSSAAMQNHYQIAPSPSQVCNPGMSAAPGQVGQVNPKNQLPPIVNVTMVALDEASAKKLVEKYAGINGVTLDGHIPGDSYCWLEQAGQNIGIDFKKLFTDQSAGPGTSGGGVPLEGPLGTSFSSTAMGNDVSDLNTLQQLLVAERLTYRIFTSNVVIRGAKWSRVESH